MGASGWYYVVPYQRDVTLALHDLQRELVASGDYYHGWEGHYYQFKSLADLRAAKRSGEFWEMGTHSILDMDRIVDAGEPDQPGAIALMPLDERIRYLGTRRPTRSNFERIKDDLLLSNILTWSGRYVVLYRDGRPDEIAFWGWSGD